MKGLLGRWLKFHLVGAIGIAVQLGILALLVSVLGVNYLIATAVAVEAAVLHNFVWHERYTWRGRPSGSTGTLLARLLRFHVSNGLVSLVGNVALMRLLVGTLRLQYMVANVLTIVACGLVNFALSEWFVFR